MSPAARTINYHLVQFSIKAYILNGFVSGFIMLNYVSKINLPTRRENLDSTLKRSYPFVTPSIGYA